MQETKVSSHEEHQLKAGYKLICLEQKSAAYRGLGFAISENIMPNVKSYKYVSDRIAILELEIKTNTNSKMKARIINAYLPFPMT